MMMVYVLSGESYATGRSRILGVHLSLDEAMCAAPEGTWEQINTPDGMVREWACSGEAAYGTAVYEYDDFYIGEYSLGTADLTDQQIELLRDILRGESGLIDALTDIINRG